MEIAPSWSLSDREWPKIEDKRTFTIMQDLDRSGSCMSRVFLLDVCVYKRCWRQQCLVAEVRRAAITLTL